MLFQKRHGQNPYDIESQSNIYNYDTRHATNKGGRLGRTTVKGSIPNFHGHNGDTSSSSSSSSSSNDANSLSRSSSYPYKVPHLSSSSDEHSVRRGGSDGSRPSIGLPVVPALRTMDVGMAASAFTPHAPPSSSRESKNDISDPHSSEELPSYSSESKQGVFATYSKGGVPVIGGGDSSDSSTNVTPMGRRNQHRRALTSVSYMRDTMDSRTSRMSIQSAFVAGGSGKRVLIVRFMASWVCGNACVSACVERANFANDFVPILVRTVSNWLE